VFIEALRIYFYKFLGQLNIDFKIKTKLYKEITGNYPVSYRCAIVNG